MKKIILSTSLLMSGALLGMTGELDQVAKEHIIRTLVTMRLHTQDALDKVQQMAAMFEDPKIMSSCSDAEFLEKALVAYALLTLAHNSELEEIVLEALKAIGETKHFCTVE